MTLTPVSCRKIKDLWMSRSQDNPHDRNMRKKKRETKHAKKTRANSWSRDGTTWYKYQSIIFNLWNRKSYRSCSQCFSLCSQLHNTWKQSNHSSLRAIRSSLLARTQRQMNLWSQKTNQLKMVDVWYERIWRMFFSQAKTKWNWWRKFSKIVMLLSQQSRSWIMRVNSMQKRKGATRKVVILDFFRSVIFMDERRRLKKSKWFGFEIEKLHRSKGIARIV